MPQLIIPTTLSNAQREELLGAITVHAGGRVYLAEPNNNRFAFERPQLPLHIYQGSEDLQSFAKESGVDVLAMEPSSTKLGALQQIFDATMFCDSVQNALREHEVTAYPDLQALLGVLNDAIAEKFYHNSAHPLSDMLSSIISSTESLQTDVKILQSFPAHQDVQSRFPQTLWQTLNKIGFRFTLDASTLTVQPKNNVSILMTDAGDVLVASRENTAFTDVAKQLLSAQVPEKIFIQTLHQTAAQQGVSVDVQSRALSSAYPLSMLRPSAMSMLRQIYAAKTVGDAHDLLAKLTFVYKPAFISAPTSSLEDEISLLLKRQAFELQSMLNDGLIRARLQQVPAQQMEAYTTTFAEIKRAVVAEEPSLDDRVVALDLLREFVVNGGLYSPDNKRESSFLRVRGMVDRALFAQPGDEHAMADANNKQAAWKSAYEALLREIPGPYQNGFSESIKRLWDISCPGGNFPPLQRIPETAKSYHRLLRDVPVQLNMSVESTLRQMVNISMDHLSDVHAAQNSQDELWVEHGLLSQQVATLSSLPDDGKPIDLYNTLKANIDVIRICSAQLDKVVSLANLLRERKAALDNMSSEHQQLETHEQYSPVQLDASKLAALAVPGSFVDILKFQIDGIENSAPHALTVGEFLETLAGSVQQWVADGDAEDLPHDFDIDAALL